MERGEIREKEGSEGWSGVKEEEKEGRRVREGKKERVKGRKRGKDNNYGKRGKGEREGI